MVFLKRTYDIDYKGEIFDTKIAAYLLDPSRSRTPLVMAQSDDGYNFDLDNIQIIEPDRSGWYCYTAMFFADEKTMLLSYCSTPASIGYLAQTTIRRIELE